MELALGLACGLVSAAAWGLTDICATVATRRAGTLVVTAWMQVVALILTVALLVLSGDGMPGPEVAMPLVAAGLLEALGYLTLYEALRRGPITVTSPIVSAFGGLTVLLAIAFLDEPISTTQALGAVLATVGVILAAVTFSGHLRSGRLAGPGVAVALVSLVIWASVTILQVEPIRAAGWIPAMTIVRMATLAALWAALGFEVVLGRARAGGRDPARRATIDRGTASLVLAMGAFDVIAYGAFAFGIEQSLAWLVGLVASFGPIATILFGVIRLGERPARLQWAGLCLVFASLVLIARP